MVGTGTATEACHYLWLMPSCESCSKNSWPKKHWHDEALLQIQFFIQVTITTKSSTMTYMARYCQNYCIDEGAKERKPMDWNLDIILQHTFDSNLQRNEVVVVELLLAWAHWTGISYLFRERRSAWGNVIGSIFLLSRWEPCYVVKLGTTAPSWDMATWSFHSL